jgi:hypothetical protein
MPDPAFTERELHIGHIRAVHLRTKEVRGWRSRHRALTWLTKNDNPADWELRPDDNPAWGLDPKVLPREDGLPADGVPVYETADGKPAGEERRG